MFKNGKPGQRMNEKMRGDDYQSKELHFHLPLGNFWSQQKMRAAIWLVGPQLLRKNINIGKHVPLASICLAILLVKVHHWSRTGSHNQRGVRYVYEAFMLHTVVAAQGEALSYACAYIYNSVMLGFRSTLYTSFLGKYFWCSLSSEILDESNCTGSFQMHYGKSTQLYLGFLTWSPVQPRPSL